MTSLDSQSGEGSGMDNIVIGRRSILTAVATSFVGCLASVVGSMSLNGNPLPAMILAWVASGFALLLTYAMLFLGIDVGTMLFAKLRKLVRPGFRPK
jgi:hypothetical protein